MNRHESQWPKKKKRSLRKSKWWTRGNGLWENLSHPDILLLDGGVMISFGRACSPVPWSCGEVWGGCWHPEWRLEGDGQRALKVLPVVCSSVLRGFGPFWSRIFFLEAELGCCWLYTPAMVNNYGEQLSKTQSCARALARLALSEKSSFGPNRQRKKGTDNWD